MRKSFVAAIAIVMLSAASAFAQTSATLKFRASSDHAATFQDGTSKLDSYSLEVAIAGSTMPIAGLALNKPTPNELGYIVVDVTAFLAPLEPATYVAYVVATGPGGTARSNPSNPFNLLPPPAPPTEIIITDDIVLYASDITSIVGSDWVLTPDQTAANGVAICEPNEGRAKLSVPYALPAEYFELSFLAVGNTPYHAWFRGKATGDSYSNDSAYIQFTGTVGPDGTTPVARIGTTEALILFLEEGSAAGLAGWGWNDNHYGGLGEDIRFAADGQQTLRVQRREDGLCIDQIVLSPGQYLTLRPGLTKNDTTIIPR